MPVVGTAGHVDHGKSTLIQALSGRDPDRWAEEKARGLTIDLGFAWTTLPDGSEISFVDVPGHERYSKNMLAGIEAIDVALLVVAADEGWMPQSEEHLAVLDLLDVRRAVVALTKVDSVDGELADLAELEVEERLAATTLEGSAIVRVSALDGTGIDALRGELAQLVAGIEPDPADRPRLWVDRSFSAQGAGTIVTGTLLGGELAVEDRVVVFPGNAAVRIRSIQSHEKPFDRIEPRRRVALNLGGMAADEIHRGEMIGRGGDWRTTTRIGVAHRSARYAEPLTNRGAYHLHIGSGSWPVTIRVVDDGLATIDLPGPLALTMGDRFIVRDTGRRMVVAGGRVLDPSPPRPARLRAGAARLSSSLDQTPDVRATALLEVRGRADTDELAIDSGGGRASGALEIGSSVMRAEVADELTTRLAELVESYHSTHPLRAGLPTAEASSRLSVDQSVVNALADRSPTVLLEGSAVRSSSFTGVRSSAQEERWEKARSTLEAAGAAAAPRVAELGLEAELVHALAREGSLVRITNDLVLLPGQVEELVGAVSSMSGPFTVSEFKDATGLSRKYAVPFLEWADVQGHTVRMGDTRRAR